MAIKQNSKDDIVKSVLRKIWSNEVKLKENLLKTKTVQNLHNEVTSDLNSIFNDDSIISLRFQKMKTTRMIVWYSRVGGYPVGNPWQHFQSILKLLEQYEAERTIKNRLENEELFIESRFQGEDLHILTGKKDGTAEKAHMIIDGKTGEIRVEDNRQEPTELVAKIEAILTLPNGKKIKTTREIIEEM